MKRIISILVVVLFNASFALAHQPDISNTVLIEKENGNWILQIKAALTAFQYEVSAKYGDNAYDTPEKFKELVIAHVTESILLEFNQDVEVVLTNPYVKLGHETNVLFEIIGMPQNIETALIRNSSFKDIRRNQSSLFILKNGYRKKQFLLNPENGHTVNIIAQNTSFILQPSSTNKAAVPLSFWTFGLMVIVSLVYGIYHFGVRGDELLLM